MAFPRAWVDAAAGTTAADAGGLKTYWLGRLAPPSLEATRPLKDRETLGAEALLEQSEAARRVAADAVYLRRLAGEGMLPGLRVDGDVLFDADLTDLVAAEAGADPTRLASRRAAVAAWNRYEYGTGVDEGAPAPAATTRPADPPTVASAPRAYHLPDDLLADDEPEAREHLAESEGFETIDEDA